MWPHHDNVWKLPVLGTLDGHSKISASAKAQTRLVADGIADKFYYPRSGKTVLTPYLAETVHAG
jgi:hypothetical protein